MCLFVNIKKRGYSAPFKNSSISIIPIVLSMLNWIRLSIVTLLSSEILFNFFIDSEDNSIEISCFKKTAPFYKCYLIIKDKYKKRKKVVALSEIKEPAKATKKKYDVFVLSYLNTFNATKAATDAGYSPKSARQQGSTLLSHPYIKQKIVEEMKNLRKRMEDEGLRSFVSLLNIAIETDTKIQRHDEVVDEVEVLQQEIWELQDELTLLNRDISILNEKNKDIDGRKTENKQIKQELNQQLNDLSDEAFELTNNIHKLARRKDHLYRDYLPSKDWEKLQSLKKSIYQDILDRGGFKALDKVEHSGSIGVSNPFTGLTEDELRRLANGNDST